MNHFYTDYAKYIILKMSFDVEESEPELSPIYNEENVYGNIMDICNDNVRGKINEIAKKLKKEMSERDIEDIKIGYILSQRNRIMLSKQYVFNFSRFVNCYSDCESIPQNEIDNLDFNNIRLKASLHLSKSVLKKYAKYIIIKNAFSLESPVDVLDLYSNILEVCRENIDTMVDDIMEYLTLDFTIDDITDIKIGYILCKKQNIKLCNKISFNLTKFEPCYSDWDEVSKEEIDSIKFEDIR